ncbi:MAG: tRNA (adenosine(37)-N6)-threonylcarbamoyltransferase complex ATPase subunit type 1 TsaE [Deltaproteobacteria bacterium]|nr:tRNA (adenosine(37)-N6)-threonylcarbamoyltransferase complex ATPase subunit type 1 TsaE [Deltaproteobacteria bacterium]
MGSWSVLSSSQRRTRNWGHKLAQLLEGGEIIGLSGELGTGKTCFVRGVAEGLGVDQDAWIRSPTFTLINEYHGRLPIYHIDLYRVSGRADQEGLNLREYLYGDGVCMVEWFEYLPVEETEDFLRVSLVHSGGNRRRLTFTAFGGRYERILRSLKLQQFKSSKTTRSFSASL